MKWKVLSLILLTSSSLAFAADKIQPYDFNVYASGDIGSSSQYYGSDFQGLTGAGGSVYFSGFSGNTKGPAHLYSVYAGKDFTMRSGSIHRGGIEAGGTIQLGSSSVHGNLHGGGNLTGGHGVVHGNVSISGNNSSLQTIIGTVATGQVFTPSMNLSAVTQYFQAASQAWGNAAPTATYQNVYGQLQVSGLQSGRNVVNLSVGDLSKAYGIKLTGPADAYVVFNILDSGSQALKDVTFDLQGGIKGDNILYNVLNANQIQLSGGQYRSILAINADITFPPGLVTGNLIGENIYGSGQVNLGTFLGFTQEQFTVPEPATYLTLAGFLVVLLVGYRKRKVVA